MHRLALVVASFVLALGLFTWIAPATHVAAQDGGYAPRVYVVAERFHQAVAELTGSRRVREVVRRLSLAMT